MKEMNYKGYLELLSHAFVTSPRSPGQSIFLSRINWARLRDLQESPETWPFMGLAVNAALERMEVEGTERGLAIARRRVLALRTRYSLSLPDADLTPYPEVGAVLPRHGVDGYPIAGQFGISHDRAREIVIKGLLRFRNNSMHHPVVGCQFHEPQAVNPSQYLYTE